MLSPEQEARKQKLIEELAELLWEEAEPEEPKTFEDIERILRRQGQEHIFPGLMSFFATRAAGPAETRGRMSTPRTLRTILGLVQLSRGQAQRLQIRAHSQNSPLLERCLLVCAAKSSFRQAEKDVEMLLGIAVSDSTLRRVALSDQRPVSSPSVSPPLGLYSRAAVDGGMVRLAEEESGTLWRQYKAVAAEDDQGNRRMEARLGEDEFLVRHFSPRMQPGAALLGDGHDGVWNLVARLKVPLGQEILDWYHLKENVYRAPLSERGKQRVTDRLWEGDVLGALSLIGTHLKDRIPLRAYLEKHRWRIPHYRKRHEQKEVIGSGTVESAIKQFDARLQVPGAYWLEASVNPMLRLRADYLNGYLHA
jgi:hypothetical protein